MLSVGATSCAKTWTENAAGVIKTLARPPLWKIERRHLSWLLGRGPPTRLTSGVVQEPNCPPVGGNDSPSSVSHSRPIFMSSRDFDFETAIWDSSAWSYDRNVLGEGAAPAIEPSFERCLTCLGDCHGDFKQGGGDFVGAYVFRSTLRVALGVFERDRSVGHRVRILSAVLMITDRQTGNT